MGACKVWPKDHIVIWMNLNAERFQREVNALLPEHLTIDGEPSRPEKHSRVAFGTDGQPHKKLLAFFLYLNFTPGSLFSLSVGVKAIISRNLIQLKWEI